MRGNGAAVFGIKTNDAYVGDTLMLGNLTVMAAVRYDKQQGFVNAAVSPANPNVPTVLPEIVAPGVSGLSWSNISPRLGLTYTLGADRRTLLRAAYSRYVNQINSGIVTPVSPGAYARQVYYFNDLNKNGVADPNEIDFAAGGLLPAPATSAGTARTRWANPSAPYTDELTAGFERELMADLSVGINGTYRKLQNFVGTVGEHTQGKGDYYSSADYTLAPNTINAILPNGQAVNQSYYILKSGIPAAKFNVIRNTPDFYETYKGLEFTATKRMSNRWMLRGNLTLQNWQQHVGARAIIDPSALRGGTGCSVCNGSEVLIQSTGSGGKSSVYINAKWEGDVTGAYQIPVIETSLGFNLSSRQGYAIPYIANVQFTNGEGTKAVLLENEPDAFRNKNVTQLDLRLAKDLRLSRFGLTLSVDAFNVTNANTVLQRNAGGVCSGRTTATKCNALPTSNNIAEVLSPRVFRLGARVNF